MEAIQSYKRHKPKQQYDAIVIGSGIGGLGAAAILAREGWKVLVLEQHYTAGGFTHSFKRRNYEWDVGIHYLGEVHRPHTQLARWFKYISNDKLHWSELGEVYDKMIFGDKVYNFVKGKEAFKDQMKTYFPTPADQASIDQYVELMYEVQRASTFFFMEKVLPKFASNILGGFMRNKMLKYARQSSLSVMQQLTNNQELIGVLLGQWGDYGLPPAQSSFAMHTMVAKHYMNGAAFPVGGCSTIADSIAEVIAQAGGLVLTNAKVKEIKVHNNKAVGVIMEDGHEMESKTILSNAGIVNTYEHLLSPEISEPLGFIKQSKSIKPSTGHICLYLGFNENTENLGLQKANYWVYPENGYDHDKNVANYLANSQKAELPVTYISFPSAKDPDWNNRYPGRSTIDIISLAPYEWFESWKNTRWKKRGEDYEALKAEFTERMLEKLYQREPQLKGKVDHAELSTPLSTQHFSAYVRGETYGLAHTPNRFEQKFLRPKTPIKGLYLCGQDIVTCGVGGGLAGGVLATAALLKKDITATIRKKT